jgi:hypothetical protein
MNSENYSDKILSFARWSEDEKLIIVSNFDGEQFSEFELKIPEDLIASWNLEDGKYSVFDQLYDNYTSELTVKNGKGTMKINLDPLQSFILKLNK